MTLLFSISSSVKQIRAPRHDSFEAVDKRQEKTRLSRTREYNNSIEAMNRNIGEGHLRAMRRQQEALFAKAASELGQDEGTFGTAFGDQASGSSWTHPDHASRRPAGVQEQVAFADLSLPLTATVHEVRRQFKQLALKYHPDRSTHDTTNVFRRVLAAREILEAWFEGE